MRKIKVCGKSKFRKWDVPHLCPPNLFGWPRHGNAVCGGIMYFSEVDGQVETVIETKSGNGPVIM